MRSTVTCSPSRVESLPELSFGAFHLRCFFPAPRHRHRDPLNSPCGTTREACVVDATDNQLHSISQHLVDPPPAVSSSVSGQSAFWPAINGQPCFAEDCGWPRAYALNVIHLAFSRQENDLKMC